MTSVKSKIDLRRKELGAEPKRSLGQNFLVSEHVIRKIIEAVKGLTPKSIVEVGPGLGSLTDELVNLNLPLQLIELDKKFAEYWTGRNLKVWNEDALQFNWNQLLEGKDCPRPQVLVSNLPYQISSSLVIDRSIDEIPLDGMVLMFQKEVAQRLKSPHGKKADNYGMLSVVAQTFWKIDLLLEASSHDFFPPPKVASRVLVFRPIDLQLRREDFLKFVKACFLHPRKLMISNLQEAMSISKENSLAVLKTMGFDELVRAQDLSPGQFVQLAKGLGLA